MNEQMNKCVNGINLSRQPDTEASNKSAANANATRHHFLPGSGGGRSVSLSVCTRANPTSRQMESNKFKCQLHKLPERLPIPR